MGWTGTETIRATSDAMSASVQGELLLLHTGSGQYYGLNEVGARVWELLQADVSHDELVDSLVGEFEVERAVLTADLDRLLMELENAGLVVVKSRGR